LGDFFTNSSGHPGYNFHISPSSVAQWTLHPPQDENTRVRITQGYKVLMEININAIRYELINMHLHGLCAEKSFMIDLLCLICVLKRETEALTPQI
jgi:hypothetical protein